MKEFLELGISEQTIKALSRKGFEEPTEIQKKVIPILLKQKKDLVAQAQTGTGKTAAFGIPLLENLKENEKGVKAIILTPTRELAIQVSEEINSLKNKKRLFVTPIYGGQSIDGQIRSLKRGVDIVVGTPGRVIDHINRGTLNLTNVQYFILDEADEMLNMGFIDDVEEILKKTNKDKCMMLFSATIPSRILSLAKNYMNNFETVKIQKETLTTNLTDQIYFEVNERDKFEALCRIIDSEENFYGLIFCRTRNDVDEIAHKLIDRGYSSEALHGDISQYQRERILKKFKTKHSNILVATDVAARGIDIINLSHVINYSIPQNPEAYVHRIGRTGRAGSEGTAITFVTPSEYRSLVLIKRIAKTDIRKEKIPGADTVIENKKNKLFNSLLEINDLGLNKDYESFATELLDKENPKKVVSSLLRYMFEDELLESSYSDIREVKVDRTGTTRLFVALGREQGYNHPKKLADFIEKETKVQSKKIRDIRIFDRFSFITAPFEESEIIINEFKKKKTGKRPLIDKAKPKN